MSQSPIKRDWMRIALVAVGSNQPNGEDTPLETVRKAGRAIESESVRRVRKSALYSTPAFPEGSGPDYINACWTLETSLSPIELLDHLHTTDDFFCLVSVEGDVQFDGCQTMPQIKRSPCQYKCLWNGISLSRYNRLGKIQVEVEAFLKRNNKPIVYRCSLPE